AHVRNVAFTFVNVVPSMETLGTVTVSAKLPSDLIGPARSTAPSRSRFTCPVADTPLLLNVPVTLVSEKPSTVALASDTVNEKLPSDFTWPDRSTPFRIGKVTWAPTVRPLVSDRVADTFVSGKPRTGSYATLASRE